ncbi:hypothetical protein KCH_40000 [Kitasatospora cheerisanensis KCTC 2395]|uniref:Uncharacterized protein n=1 Tax=Kitasatospora cheerisanensis KCTC 2395 TaxID=1348663 RepID=A0A066YW77_9ACTN|nr:hypothetical protein KCH_40000 [Kitasatospora cheerisanensis KCTC 2395]
MSGRTRRASGSPSRGRAPRRARPAPGLAGPPQVLRVAAERRHRLGDQRVQLVQFGVQRAEQLVVGECEVVDLHPQGGHVHVQGQPGQLGRRDPLLQLLPLRIRPHLDARYAHPGNPTGAAAPPDRVTVVHAGGAPSTTRN